MGILGMSQSVVLLSAKLANMEPMLQTKIDKGFAALSDKLRELIAAENRFFSARVTNLQEELRTADSRVDRLLGNVSLLEKQMADFTAQLSKMVESH